MKRVGLCLAICLSFAAAAEEHGGRTAPPEDTFRETQNLIDEMQRRIDQINDVSSARDEEIEFLNKQINEAIQHIVTQRKDNTSLQQNNLVVREELTSLYTTQDELNAKLTEVTRDRETVVADLRSQIAELIDLLTAEKDTTARLRDGVGTLSVELQSTKGEKERTQKDLSDARSAMSAAEQEMARRRDEIEGLVGKLSAAEKTSQLRRDEIEGLVVKLSAAEKTSQLRRDEIEGLVVKLSAAEKTSQLRRDEIEGLERKLAAAEVVMERRRVGIGDLERQLSATEKTVRRRRARIDDLEEKLAAAATTMQLGRVEIESLRNRIAALDAALRASRMRTVTQGAQMADLERQLNIALMEKVRGLSRYRSEFFGRLREVLGERPDIRVVGDRFIFQSEVLFESGSVELDPGGVATLGRLAQTLREVASRIPRDLNWVLRVDGHTDRVPIRNFRYPSNWELSSARAISVVKYLVDQGLPAERMAATGFAEFQPLDTRDDEIAYRRNRRIEFKLTQR